MISSVLPWPHCIILSRIIHTVHELLDANRATLRFTPCCSHPILSPNEYHVRLRFAGLFHIYIYIVVGWLFEFRCLLLPAEYPAMGALLHQGASLNEVGG